MDHLSVSPRRANVAGRRRSLSFLGLLASVCLVLAGCAGSGSSTEPGDSAAGAGASSAAGESFPVDVLSGKPDGGEYITVESRPTAIVSLSATATEMLWAIEAGDQVVAVDDQSNYPPGVPTTKLSGYEPNVEATLAYEPDLVVAAADSGDLVASLEAAGVPTLLLPSASDLPEAYSQMERLGAATGHVAEAAELVADTRTGIEQAVADAPDVEGATYFHELTPELFTATGGTFIGEIYGLFGLTSIADAAASGDEYPQLSGEYVVSADPDFVFLADTDCCGVTADKVRGRAGWGELAAVENDQIHVVDKDIASRWGPRVDDFAELVNTVLTEYARTADSSPPAG